MRNFSSHYPDIKYIVLILVTSVVFFWKVLLYPDQLFNSQYNDTIHFFYPVYNFALGALRNGDFPSWNPLILSGHPLIANPQFSLFYPLNFVFFILPSSTAFGLSYVMHVFLGGVFMYYFGKHLGLERICAFFSAFIFMFGGFITAHIYAGHYSMICAAAWLPLLFLTFDIALKKRSLIWSALTGLVLGIQLLAGHAQITYISLIGLAIYLLYRLYLSLRDKKFIFTLKPISIFIMAVILGILISAVQFFPAYEYSTYSSRAGGLDYETATSLSLNPGLLSLILSNPWSGPTGIFKEMPIYNFWEYLPYIGILPLVFFIFAGYFLRKNGNVKFFLLMGLAGILLAMGKYFPPYWLLYKFAPGFDSFRVPARFILLFYFAEAIIAGFGFSFLRTKIDAQKVKSSLEILIVLILFAVIIAIVAIIPIHTYSAIRISMAYLAVLLIVTAGLLFCRFKNKLTGKYLDLVIIIFTLLNLWFFHMSYVDTAPIGKIYQAKPFIEYLVEHSKGYRVYDPEEILPKNNMMIFQIADINGYDASALNYYALLLGEHTGRVGADTNIVSASQGISNLGKKLDLLNVKYVISAKSISNADFKLVYSDPDVFIYENLHVLPKAFFAANAEVFSTNREILARLSENTFDISQTVLLQQKPVGIPLTDDKGTNTVSVDEFSSHSISISTTTSTPGFLLLSETWYPAWKVYVDGKPGEIYQTDVALMSVFIKPGSHTVQFVYESQTYRLGAIASIVTTSLLAVALGIYFIYRPRQRVSETSPKKHKS